MNCGPDQQTWEAAISCSSALSPGLAFSDEDDANNPASPPRESTISNGDGTPVAHSPFSVFAACTGGGDDGGHDAPGEAPSGGGTYHDFVVAGRTPRNYAGAPLGRGEDGRPLGGETKELISGVHGPDLVEVRIPASPARVRGRPQRNIHAQEIQCTDPARTSPCNFPLPSTFWIYQP